MDGKMGGKSLRKTTGSLNLSSQEKKRFYGISPQTGIRFGAREWNYMTLFKNTELESQSLGENPGKSERGKCSPVRSPSARERESRIKKKRKPSKSIKKRPSPVLKTLGPSRLGSTVAYIHFMRKFQRKNNNLKANDLLNKATRLWCRLHGNQRQQLERPLWVVRTG
ncbi:protamine-like protein 99C isoform X2 [Drosophila subpulchrella]|uniref:protamine-like protein 99C isoform X2 n=1 Tax=Drosophila subpulchrella TaxID=1486046 RepID=UPI0018A16800|nr:protamine-like protein 99C isoform X2 [Drosophila subpulchrella]